MPNPNYVCTLCSQTFTRRWRGSVHNTNIHSGVARIVRLLDYIVGRANGEFAPSDPSWYRRPNKNTNWANRTHATGIDSRGDLAGEAHEKEFQGFLGNRTPVQRPNPDRAEAVNQKDHDSPTDHEDKFEGINKLAELKRLAGKYLPRDDAQHIVNVTCLYCMSRGDNTPLDNALKELRRKVRLRESLDYLNQS